MGGSESKDGEEVEAPFMTDEMKEVLRANTYYPGENAKYPYFLVQVKESEELPYGDNEILVSDCIAAYCQERNVTHIIAQTHGWNTPRKSSTTSF